MIDLGINFSDLKDASIGQQRNLSSAADTLLLETESTEGNIGSDTTTVEKPNTATTEKQKEDEIKDTPTLNVNELFAELGKDSSIDKDGQQTAQSTEPGKEDITKPKGPSSTTSQTSSNVPFTLVFKSLQEEGALSEFDSETFEAELNNPEIGTAKALQNVFRREADIVKQEILAEQQEDFKEYVSLLDAGVNRNVANNLIQQQSTFSKLTPEQLEGETEEATNYRKAIIAQHYKNTTSFSDEKILKTIDKLVKSGEDEEEAKEALPQIQAYNLEQVKKTKDLALAKEKEKADNTKAAIAKYKEVINATDEIIPGQKINKQTKQKIEDFTLNGKIWELRNKDPYKFDTILSYLALNGAFTGKFTKPVTAAKSSTMEDLERALSNTSKTGVNPVTKYNGGGGDEEGSDQEFELVSNLLKRSKKPL